MKPFKIMCGTCFEVKSNYLFPLKKASASGYAGTCKLCTSDKAQEPKVWLQAQSYGCTTPQNHDDISDAWSKAMGGKRFGGGRTRKVVVENNIHPGRIA